MSDPRAMSNGVVPPTSSRRGRGLPPHIVWPGIIVGLLLMSATMCAITIVAATTDRSFGVEPAYYTRALAWDDTLQQQETNRRLGWAIDVQFQTDDAGRQALVATLTDAAGEPLDDAVLRACAFHRARINDRQELTFKSVGGGRYSAPVAIRRAGIWEFRLTADRGAQTFTQVVEHIIIGAGD